MKKYIMVIAGVLLMNFTHAQGTIDRSKQPELGPAPILNIKQPVVYKMQNGITVLIVEDHRLPKVSARYSIDAGPIIEGNKAGEGTLMGQMLNEGTKTMPKAVFNQAVARMGASVNLYFPGGNVTSLTRYFKSAFKLMGQALMEPAFTPQSFDRLKTKDINSIKSNSKNVKSIAGRVNNALAYGKTHPAGEFETEETYQNLSLQDIKDDYNKYITPSRAYLTIIGDIKVQEAKDLAVEVFGTWKGAALTLPKFAEVFNPIKTEIDIVDVPSAVQSQISVINLENLEQNNPDYFPALLVNYILGGGPESRLFTDLREKHGFTYGCYSDLTASRFQSTFEAAASVRNAKVDSAVFEILNQIKLIRTEKVTDEELIIAKELYNGSFALGLEDPSRSATFASNILINNLPSDFYQTYLQKVNAVTPDDILRVAQKYINYDNTRIIIVGNTAQTLDGLKKTGYPIKLYDVYASPIIK